MNPIELSIFSNRIEAVCEEMGVVLRRTAFSPNIKERLDYSCAIFDAKGELCAQAAHIPVHLGSMAYAMRDIVEARAWAPGEMVILNDPFLGGTHLPDVTVIAPLFADARLAAFVVNRAHHADIGASAPGSMPLSTRLDEEGVVIAPTPIIQDSRVVAPMFEALLARIAGGHESRGDFHAQFSANRCGLSRLQLLLDGLGLSDFEDGLRELNDYGERLARAQIRELPDGVYQFTDYLDDDGQGQDDIAIVCRIEVQADTMSIDFTGTAPQVTGNINCPLSVAAAGVYYVFRCLLPDYAPACAGIFRPVTLRAPAGSVLHAQRPAAVAAGNVETSMRVVDTVLGALAQAIPRRIPAASQGTMNNLAMGTRGAQGWSYYETLGGGMGAGAHGGGLSGVQTHMTNTLNTPVEALEMHYPLRMTRYALRTGSGGAGQRSGGDGLIREYEFLQPATVTLLTERRRRAPWGVKGGGAGACGQNLLNDRVLPAKTSFTVQSGDRLTIKTPGGGGWGKA